MTSIDQGLRLHRNDRAGLLLTLVFGGLLAGQTWSGKGPAGTHVCQPPAIEQTAATLTAPQAEPPAPVVALETATLDLEASGGALTIVGTVASEQDKATIIAAANRNFEADKIADMLSVDPAVSALRAADKTEPLVAKLKALDTPVQLRAKGNEWTLTGEVGDDAAKSRIGSEVAALIGADGLVMNELTVKPSQPIEHPTAPPAEQVLEAAPPERSPAEPAASAEYVTQAATADGLVSHSLPNGSAIEIAEGGLETKIIEFVEDPSKPIDKGIWFDFDRLHFDTASTAISEESKAQIHAVGEILRAYPQLAIKIGGYTDNVGDPNVNLTLSSERAKAVKAALVAQGIEDARIEWEGYGAQYPAADNATEEGRAKNRRTSVSVRTK